MLRVHIDYAISIMESATLRLLWCPKIGWYRAKASLRCGLLNGSHRIHRAIIIAKIKQGC